MSRFGDADQRLATAFGKHVARWSREQGASAAAAAVAQQAAAMVSQATADGHSCLAIDELARALDAATATPLDAPPLDTAALCGALLESQVVGSPEAPGSLPLILDDQRLYLHRYFDYECRLARNLCARSTTRSALEPRVVALLDRLFAGNASAQGAPDWQRAAVISALRGRLTIISGGPGTGKTTTVVNLLACLLEAHPQCRIGLTAPTGKAAARMIEVVLQRADHLPDELRAKLPTESSTIHRLLGSLPNGNFRHHAANPLPIDVLIVDEASMLDLAMAVHLVEAVPQNARIILLGDKDQLAAVESGAVFCELSAQTDQVEQVIWLRRNYRFAADSAIGRLAMDTNEGHAGRVLERLQHPPDASLRWLDDSGSVPSTACMREIFHGYAPFMEALRARDADARSITAAFARFRVLCAVRDGPWGVNAINHHMAADFRRTVQHAADPGLRSEWYPGRPVMVLRNDPVLKLFNGDIGMVFPDAGGTLRVYFPADNGEFRAIAPVRLPEHETAFAMTVHKSQGSEFDEILLLLPAEMNRTLTRELFYTAVTRARERVTIAASAAVLGATIATPTKRVSGLLERLRRLLPSRAL